MTTPIIIAALARKPRRNPHAVRSQGGRGAAQNPPHNYLAQAPKKKAGAPFGNRNAARRPAKKGDNKAQLLAFIRAFCARVDAIAAAVPERRR